jgi:hypothetical protein
MKLLIIQFSSSSVISFHLGADILLNILFSETLNLCPSLHPRDQVSHHTKQEMKLFFRPS